MVSLEDGVLKRIIFGLLLFTLFTNASCYVTIRQGVERDTSGRPIELINFNVNDSIIIGNEVTPQNTIDRLTVDIFLYDSTNQKIGSAYLQIPNETNYGETIFNLTNSFINGTYRIESNLQEYDSNSTMVCSYNITKNIVVNSSRIAYNTTTFDLNTDLLLSLQEKEVCQEYPIGDSVSSVCVKGMIPGDLSFDLGEIDYGTYEDTNFSLVVTSSQPQYSLAFVQALLKAWEQEGVNNANLAETINTTNTGVLSLIDELKETNQNRLDSLIADNTVLSTKNESLKNSNTWAWVFGILIGLIICGGIYFYLVMRAKQPLIN